MDYSPGWGPVVVRMLTARTAADRAAFVLPLIEPDTVVLDLGCGPGTITAGLPGRVLGVDPAVEHLPRTGGFAAGSGYHLPVATGAVHLVFAHALVEHLADPAAVLAECRRVLRPGGVIALSTSDWSGAAVHPLTLDVQCALAAHHEHRRAAGGDPFAGRTVPELVRASGFTVSSVRLRDRADLGYRELARYIAGRVPPGAGRDAALRWAAGGDGSATQRWVELLARSPGGAAG